MKPLYTPSTAEVKAWRDYMTENKCGVAKCANAFGVTRSTVQYHVVNKQKRRERWAEKPKPKPGKKNKPVSEVLTKDQRHFKLCEVLGVDPWGC